MHETRNCGLRDLQPLNEPMLILKLRIVTTPSERAAVSRHHMAVPRRSLLLVQIVDAEVVWPAAQPVGVEEQVVRTRAVVGIVGVVV